MKRMTNFRPEIDGFAFANQWTYGPAEAATIKNIMTGALEGVLAITTPMLLPLLGPVAALGPGALAAIAAILGPQITQLYLSENPDFGLCGSQSLETSG